LNKGKEFMGIEVKLNDDLFQGGWPSNAIKKNENTVG
jgi:hypothetical protein